MLKIGLIGGDGIGPEVCEQGLRCVDVLTKKHGFEIQVTELPYGGQRYLDEGKVIDDDEVQALKDYDALYLGAVGRPDVAPGIVERGLLLKMRFDLDQYINLRPVQLYPGIDTPLANKTADHINMIVVRENTEDLYCGVGGFLRKGTQHEVATQEMIATRMGVERCLRYAFELARTRPRKHLTLVGKTNVLTFAHNLWARAFDEIGEEYPDIERLYHHVDACCMYMVATPEIYDTVVTTNMFGDIITDLGAAIAGGMGVAASGNLNPDGTAPSMFEPVHGSAPDIAGQGKANPIAAIASVAMLLKETGRIKGVDGAVAAGTELEEAVARTCPKFAGQRLDRLTQSTSEVADMVISELG